MLRPHAMPCRVVVCGAGRRHRPVGTALPPWPRRHSVGRRRAAARLSLTRALRPPAAGRVTFPGPDGLVFTGELAGGFPCGRGALAVRGGAVLSGVFARVGRTLLLDADGELALPDGRRLPARMRAWRVEVDEAAGAGGGAYGSDAAPAHGGAA